MRKCRVDGCHSPAAFQSSLCVQHIRFGVRFIVENWPSGPKIPKPYTNIYAIRMGGFVKIGKSDNVRKRLATLQTACPQELELLGQMRASPSLERLIHRSIDKYRAHGEWFFLGNPTVDMVVALIRGYGAP